MKYNEFKNNLNDAKPSAIYLFEGEDSFFSSQGLSLLVNKFITERSLNYGEFNSENLKIEDLITSLDCFPFLSEKRMTVIREFYPKTDEVKILTKYFESYNESSIFVIINSKSFAPLKKLNQVCVVDCNRMDSSMLARWVKGECQNQGIVIDLENAKLISEFCLCDMMRIKNETDKLCAYALEKGEITKQDIESMVSRDSDYKIYQMTDCIGKKDFDGAIRILDEMLYRGETPQRIIASIYNYFRRLLHVSICEKSDKEIGELFGIKDHTEFIIRKTKQQASLFKKRSLKSAVDYLAEADYRYKSGKSSVDNEMWISVFKIIVG